jgi:hypothetical protein
VGGTTHLHGYTASWGFLVPVEQNRTDARSGEDGGSQAARN